MGAWPDIYRQNVILHATKKELTTKKSNQSKGQVAGTTSASDNKWCGGQQFTNRDRTERR